MGIPLLHLGLASCFHSQVFPYLPPQRKGYRSLERIIVTALWTYQNVVSSQEHMLVSRGCQVHVTVTLAVSIEKHMTEQARRLRDVERPGLSVDTEV